MTFAPALAMINRLLAGKPQVIDGSIYEYGVRALTGKPVDLAEYKKKKLLIVNTASRCAYTPQYAALQELHERYGDRLAILGFPSNDFFRQEPGTASDISEFCQVNYGVTFPMMEKIHVKGRSAHPLFKWLAGKTGQRPSWNFCKYLVTEDGRDVYYFSSRISPLDPTITDKLL